MIHKLIQKLLGRSETKAAIVQSKNDEADEIVRGIVKDIAKVTKKVNRLNLVTSSKLEEISSELQTITERIAVATGGKNRGLR